jgi:hypothetical protein
VNPREGVSVLEENTPSTYLVSNLDCSICTRSLCSSSITQGKLFRYSRMYSFNHYMSVGHHEVKYAYIKTEQQVSAKQR